ncbi:MAG: hypothetical protein K6E96_00900 [Bacteroidales bacterium]|nr:hypothetical protein [Bacteroidales bacterium]
MKKTITICLAIISFAATVFAQNKSTADSIYSSFIREYGMDAQAVSSQDEHVSVPLNNQPIVPRYKMYPTQNINILLKLDTKRGRIWMVQYRLKDQSSMEVIIDDYAAVSEKEGWNGRFEMYPTQNIHNFIMLDTETGQVYQVQWSVDYDKRFVEKIY